MSKFNKLLESWRSTRAQDTVKTKDEERQSQEWKATEERFKQHKDATDKIESVLKEIEAEIPKAVSQADMRSIANTIDMVTEILEMVKYE